MSVSADKAWLILLLVPGLWGCSGTETGSLAPPRGQLQEESDHMATGPNPIPGEIMQRVLDEVSRQSGVGRDELVLVRTEQVTWNDGALGCPQPNVEYIQMIIEGYWVIVRAGQEEFDYRIDSRGRFTRCQGATRQAPIVYPPDS